MSALDRLKPWTTTGIGSLPFDDGAEAAAHAVGAYGLPFCPQLPRLEGDMISEWLGADPGRCGWSTDRDCERPRAWDVFLAELRRRPPAHRLVKLQVTGPATLACALQRRGDGGHSRRAALALALELAHWLAANATAQVRRLREAGFDAVLVVDEPALAVFGADDVERAWEPLRPVAAAWGLHLCCHVPWELIERAEPEVLSFDLALEPIERASATTLSRHVARGGWVAWGTIRVEGSERSAHGIRRLEQTLTGFGADPQSSLVTASCGSGRMSVKRERELASDLIDVANAMRELEAAGQSQVA